VFVWHRHQVGADDPRNEESCGKGLDVEAPQQRVPSDVKLVAIAAAEAAQAVAAAEVKKLWNTNLQSTAPSAFPCW